MVIIIEAKYRTYRNITTNDQIHYSTNSQENIRRTKQMTDNLYENTFIITTYHVQ